MVHMEQRMSGELYAKDQPDYNPETHKVFAEGHDYQDGSERKEKESDPSESANRRQRVPYALV